MRTSLLALLAPVAAAMANDHQLEERQSIANLDALFKKMGKEYFGSIADSGLLSRSQNTDLLKSVFGQVTPENSGKWDAVEGSRGNFNFGGLDQVVNWAQTNNKLVRGHTTVWHSQLPSWVSQINDKSTLTSVIENHVTKVVGRYAGKIFQWDIVNEMFEENGSLRNSVFSRVLGEDFVRISFEAGRKADPKCKLYINDYNTVEKGASYAKTTSMVTYVKKWIAAGVPIDGIGAQAHLVANEAGNVPASLKHICSAAPDCAITELDIAGASASDYMTVVKSCVEIANCVGITIWGTRDSDSWRASSNPLLFNGNYQPKPAFSSLAAYFSTATAAKRTNAAAATTAAAVQTAAPATLAAPASTCLCSA